MRLLPTHARCAGRSTAALAAVALALPLATAASAAGPVTAATGPPAGDPTARADFVSRPDIAAPALATHPTGRESPGLLLTTPGVLEENQFGAAIYDNDGELVWWAEPEPGHNYFNMSPVSYAGEPALAVFNTVEAGPGDFSQSECVVLDSSYTEVASFAVQGAGTDAHEITFSPDGSRVLLLSYRRVPADLSPYGGPADTHVYDSVIQEQDVSTGEVTFEWSALDHIPVTESQESLTEPAYGAAFDLIHVNSMDYDTDGDLLVSARNTSTVYKVDRATGEILWRLGGESNDFAIDDAAGLPSYQHDARRLPDGRLSVFDNGNKRQPQVSRGAVYEIDERTMTAELVEDLRTETPAYGFAVGSNRQLKNGNRLVSFGTTGRMAEFEAGVPVFTGSFDPGWWTYRTERAPWRATPDAPPDAALGEPAGDGSRTMHMSWNGATDVYAWRIEAGQGKGDLTTLATTRETGFETAAEIAPPDDADVYRVTALSPFGRPLGSRTLTL